MMGQVLSREKYVQMVSRLEDRDFPLRKLLPAGLYLLDLVGWDKNRGMNRNLTGKISELYGVPSLSFHWQIHQANKIVHALVGLFITVFFGIIVSRIDSIFLIFSTLLIGGLYFLPDYEINKKIIQRRLKIQIEFPDFLNNLTLLISTGMTVPRAWEKIVKENKHNSPLYKELNKSLVDIQAGKPLLQAYEDFARRCRIPEINKFVTVILQNMKKGNAELVSILSVQSNECWEMRKHAARRLGEEASTKLLFPLILMFIAILLIVSVPAIIALKSL